MARILSTLFSLLALLMATARAVGNSFDLYPVQKSLPKTYVQNVSVSWTVPSAPSSLQGLVGHFFALGGYGMVTTVNVSAYSTSPSFPKACAAKPGQWCVQAYTIGTAGGGGAYAAVNAGDVLKFSVDRVGGDSGSYLTKVTRGTTVLSSKNTINTVSTTGVSFIMGDCDGSDDQPAQVFKSLSIVHALPYPNYNRESTLSANGASSSGLYTTDGGATWKIDTISLKSMYCP